MRRKQIYIEQEQERRIKVLAHRRGVPEAVVIRELLEAGLGAEPDPTSARAGHDNPLLELIGFLEDDDLPEDSSVTYKRELYGQR